MKFDCGLSGDEELALYKSGKHPDMQWHKFFTILPRRVGYRDCRFLETIERRLVNPHSFYFHIENLVWEYRALEKK